MPRCFFGLECSPNLGMALFHIFSVSGLTISFSETALLELLSPHISLSREPVLFSFVIFFLALPEILPRLLAYFGVSPLEHKDRHGSCGPHYL